MSTNKHVALAYTYIEAIQALDLDALSNILSSELSFQFLPSASLGDMGKPLNRDAFLAVGRNLRALLKDSRLPVRPSREQSAFLIMTLAWPDGDSRGNGCIGGRVGHSARMCNFFARTMHRLYTERRIDES